MDTVVQVLKRCRVVCNDSFDDMAFIRAKFNLDMKQITQWMIELGGDIFDLKELLRLNSLPGFSVVEENDRFYLRAAEFNSSSDASDVLNRGIEIVRIMNGIAQIEIQNWENVKVIGVAHDETNGTRTQFMSPLSFRSRSRMSFNATVIKADGPIDNSTQKSTFESFFELSQADTEVEKALRIYGSREHTWSNLYIIYEIIEFDVGGKGVIVSKGWSSNSKIEVFKRTANSVTAAGDDARHGKEETVPPSPPMLLVEAESMIEGILRQWLLTK